MKRFVLMVTILLVALTGFTDSVKDWLNGVDLDDGNVYIFYDPVHATKLDVGHVDIYVGDVEIGGIIYPKQVIGASLYGGGVIIQSVGVWDYPFTKEAVLLKVKYPPKTDVKEEFKKVREFLFDQWNKPYTLNYLNSSVKRDNDEWYCSELARAAVFLEGEGINIGMSDGALLECYVPVAPVDIFNDTDTEEVARRGIPNPIPKDAYRVHNLRSGKSFFSISDSLEDFDLSEGDVIEIDPGSYLERVEVKTSGITLRAKEFDQEKLVAKTVVRSGKRWWQEVVDIIDVGLITGEINLRPTVISISASKVCLSGLTLTGAWGDDEYCGVRLEEEANYCQISDCIIFNNPVGIGVREADYLDISRNRLSYNSYGIGLLRSYGDDISWNLIENSFEKGLFAVEDESQCASEMAVKESRTNSLSILLALRDSWLSLSAVTDYYKVSSAVGEIFLEKEDLRREAEKFIAKWSGKLESFLDEEKDFFVLEEEVSKFICFLRKLEDLVIDSEVRFVLEKVVKEAEKFSEKNFKEAVKDSPYFSSEKKIFSAKIEVKQPTYFYLNEVVDNKEWLTGYQEGFYWFSPKEIEYYFKGKSFKSLLGNFWSDNTILDENGDGIDDENFGDDNYPLVGRVEEYNFSEFKSVFVPNWTLY